MSRRAKSPGAVRKSTSSSLHSRKREKEEEEEPEPSPPRPNTIYENRSCCDRLMLVLFDLYFWLKSGLVRWFLHPFRLISSIYRLIMVLLHTPEFRILSLFVFNFRMTQLHEVPQLLKPLPYLLASGYVAGELMVHASTKWLGAKDAVDASEQEEEEAKDLTASVPKDVSVSNPTNHSAPKSTGKTNRYVRFS